jgi:hypothetical protein
MPHGLGSLIACRLFWAQAAGRLRVLLLFMGKSSNCILSWLSPADFGLLEPHLQWSIFLSTSN